MLNVNTSEDSKLVQTWIREEAELMRAAPRLLTSLSGLECNKLQGSPRTKEMP